MSTHPSEAPVSIDYQIDKFRKHLSIQANDRIILSGPFGTGKSYFLREFFKIEHAKYEVFSISPVNYSVSSNNDIFELIKYDILFQLIEKDTQFDKEDFSKLMTGQMAVLYSKDTQKAIGDFFLTCLEKFTVIGKDVLEIYNKLKNVFDTINNYHKSIQIDDKSEITDYLDKFQSTNNYPVYAEDQFVKFIRKYIQYFSDSVNEKKPVLVIDDFDRIDPEHIFRILNIFSAHIDWRKTDPVTNKFGFSHLIIVCDISNIRNIYSSKYGSQTDFTGYIDKFYSHYIFFHNITPQLSSYIEDVITSVTFGKNAQIISNKRLEIITILQNLTNYGHLNIRKLKRIKDLDIEYISNPILKYLPFSNMDFYIIHQILSTLLDPMDINEPLDYLRRLKLDFDFTRGDEQTKRSLNYCYISALAAGTYAVTRQERPRHLSGLEFKLQIDSPGVSLPTYSIKGQFDYSSTRFVVQQEDGKDVKYPTLSFAPNYLAITGKAPGSIDDIPVDLADLNTLDLIITTYRFFDKYQF